MIHKKNLSPMRPFTKIRFADLGNLLFLLTAATFLLVLLLGGAPNRSNWQNLIITFAAVSLLSVALTSGSLSKFWQLPSSAKIFGCLLIAIPLVQLIPLPPTLFTHLPGRSLENGILDIVGLGGQWRSISVDVNATIFAYLSMIPGIAVFLAVLNFDRSQIRSLLILLLAIFAIAVFIGTFQFISRGVWFGFYEISHKESLLGFFANRNHMGLFVAISALSLFWLMRNQAKNRQLNYQPFIVISSLLLIVAMATMSRSGIFLVLLSLIFVYIVELASRKKGNISKINIAIIAASIAAAMVAVYIFLTNKVFERTLNRFISSEDEKRWSIWENTMEMSADYFPFGSGLGTFVPAFKKFESLFEIDSQYVNHAHNEYLELIAETGIFGLLLMACFLVAFLARLVAIRHKQKRNQKTGNLPLYAAMVLFLTLLHSFVDYPLRTQAIAVVFGLFLALFWSNPKASSSAVDKA